MSLRATLHPMNIGVVPNPNCQCLNCDDEDQGGQGTTLSRAFRYRKWVQIVALKSHMCARVGIQGPKDP